MTLNLNSNPKTSLTLTSSLTQQEAPHYYMMYLPDGGTRCCGQYRDAVRLKEMYPDANVEKVYPPEVPKTVNITAQNLGRENALNEGAKQLPQSELEPLDL